MSENNEYNKIAALEAVLFTYGEPILLKDLARRLGLTEEDCRRLLETHGLDLANDLKRGLTLVWNGGRVQLVTKPDLQKLIQNFIKEEFREALTPAALEAIAIVAYLGPVARATIDQIRGVNSSFILRSLLVRGLIERSSDPERGNVYRYDLNSESLKHLGLLRKEGLPEYQNYKDVLNKFAVEQTTAE
jgi:segregation and condensation protein B